jgi:hypothetical protein
VAVPDHLREIHVVEGDLAADLFIDG